MIERLKNHLRELKQTLATLSWKEKIEHLWIYYKHVLLIAGAIGFAIWFVIHIVASSNQVTLLTGTALNVYITDEGQTDNWRGKPSWMNSPIWTHIFWNWALWMSRPRPIW